MKKIYIVGICGKLTGPMAVSLRKNGYEVLGSDKAFYPPMSDYIKENGVELKIGFKKEHIDLSIDLLIYHGGILQNNIELVTARELGIPMTSPAKFMQEHFIKKNSIVISGTYGKTMTTAFVAHILEDAGFNPTYMIGGDPINFVDPTKLTDSDWSVFEGDEYISSSEDLTPKFIYYNPKYLIFNAAEHDHLNIYKTKEDYLNAYRSLINKMPANSLIIANKCGENVMDVLNSSDISSKKVIYVNVGNSNNLDSEFNFDSYQYLDNLTKFSINHNGEKIDFETSILGIHNIRNLVMGLSLAISIGIDIEKIKMAASSFKGVKRRLEVIQVDPYMIIDDYAHSPIKADGSINSIKDRFPNKKLFAIYSPHSLSSRLKDSLNEYQGYFKNAEKVLILPIYHSKTFGEENNFTSHDIASHIGENAIGFDSIDNLVKYVKDNVVDDNVVLVMSSGNTDSLISKLK